MATASLKRPSAKLITDTLQWLPSFSAPSSASSHSSASQTQRTTKSVRFLPYTPQHHKTNRLPLACPHSLCLFYQHHRLRLCQRMSGLPPLQSRVSPHSSVLIVQPTNPSRASNASKIMRYSPATTTSTAAGTTVRTGSRSARILALFHAC